MRYLKVTQISFGVFIELPFVMFNEHHVKGLLTTKLMCLLTCNSIDLNQTTRYQEFPGSIPTSIKNFSVRSMVVMINAPMTCLTFNLLEKV